VRQVRSWLFAVVYECIALTRIEIGSQPGRANVLLGAQQGAVLRPWRSFFITTLFHVRLTLSGCLRRWRFPTS